MTKEELETRLEFAENDKELTLAVAKAIMSKHKFASYNEVLAYLKGAADATDDFWIPCDERMPEDGQKCLVYRNCIGELKETTGIWKADRKVFLGMRHGTNWEDTLAWQQLPEPQKEVTE